MIQDKKERSIAKITSISAYKLEAKLLSHINSFNINGFEDIYQFIRLNGYVLICIENNFIVASISSIRESDDKSTFTDKDALNRVNATKVLELFPLGVLEKQKFTFGVSNYPMLYSDVIYIKDKELNQLFTGRQSQGLEIGTWTLMDKYKVKIDINDFFGFHSAILGNTGSGKSCTISAILQGIYKDNYYPKSQFIFFDVNGEYKQAFLKENEPLENINLKYFYFLEESSKKENNTSKDSHYQEENFYLPLNLLNIDEWKLLLKASEKAQAPVLINAIYMSGKGSDIKKRIVAFTMKALYNSLEQAVPKYQKIQSLKQKLGEKYNNIDEGYNNQYGNFNCDEKAKEFLRKLDEIVGDYQELVKQFNNYDNINLKNLSELGELIEYSILWEEAHGNKVARDYCSSLITRLKSLSNREEFKFLTSTENSQPESTKDYVESVIKEQNITIINFDNMDDEVIEVVSTVLARIFFEYTKEQEDRNTKPIHLILDEAHRYISNRKGNNYFFEANYVFERIAKEARKYGLFLILSSQRPCELNETVLSQCSNFIIHRIQNPNDLSYIRSMTPFISKSMLDQLPSIPRQEALIFGTATNLPVLFKVKNANPLPYSKNNDIETNWR